jgi:RNA polymerase sigma-70 factor, ECF subfamily
VDTASSKPDDLLLPVAAGEPVPAAPVLAGPLAVLLEDLWAQADAEACGLSRVEFGQVLATVGAKLNYNLPPGLQPDASHKAAFYRSLHLAELALAHACALGRESAWERFLGQHRGPLIQAAIAITGSATLGEELADSLYAELYGLRERDGQRRSPLATYTGRGSLAGWLRTTLVQRFRDHHRRTHRETPLDNISVDDIDRPTPAAPASTETTALADAVARTLVELDPEDRFLLAAYYLDRQTLLQIARTLAVHEATISRRLKRLVAGLHKQLLRNLCSSGLSRAAAEEALGADPRDIEINLRALLQTSQSSTFSAMRAASDRL